EIQATISSKLSYFINDTIPESLDSIIVTLENNFGQMRDTDVSLVFAHLNKNSFEAAAQIADNLPSEKSHWKYFLQNWIMLEQDTEKVYRLLHDTVLSAFFTDIASDDTLQGNAGSR